MWILPKQLHTSAYVPDTEALISGLEEQSQACEQSLIVRSKPLPLRTWLRKWKQDNWMQLLSGRMLKHSHGRAFETRWTFFLEDIHANHSVLLEQEPEKTILVTSGHGSQKEFAYLDPRSAYLRTSRDTLALDSEKLSLTWNAWVTERRLAYSLRLSVVSRTRGSEYSYWPTAAARDWKDTPGMVQKAVNKDGSQRNRTDQLARAVYFQAALDNQGKHGNRIGLLNPRWTEALMGVPVGWVMPSCSHPIVNPAKCVESQSVQNVQSTTQSAHVLGPIATMTDSRVDELRLLGNGVVPATCELAFKTLLKELYDSLPQT